MKQAVRIGVALVLAAAGILIGMNWPTADFGQVRIRGADIRVEVADDEAERERGLSGRESLPPENGMWFSFEAADRHGIWMKDMRFNIDVVWVGSDLKVVTLKTNLPPDSYPDTIFRPSAPARYVLEVPAGFAAQYGIDAGDRVEVNLD